MSLKSFARRHAPTSVLLAWRKHKARQLVAACAALESFAEVPVKVNRLRYFRREEFPDSGPTPWLDRPETLDTMTEGGPYEGRAQDMHLVVPQLREVLPRERCATTT